MKASKRLIETDKEKAQRLERQMDRLKFKQKKQILVKEAEITRLNNHLARGKELLKRVTQEMGGKQQERDLAMTRADALNKLLICVISQTGPVQVKIEDFKKSDQEGRCVDLKVNDGVYSLTIKAKEDETDGTEAEHAVVSSPNEENESSRNSQTYGNEEDASVPCNQGAQS